MEKVNLVSKMQEYGASSLTDLEILTMVVGDEAAAYQLSEIAGGSLKGIEKLYPIEVIKIPGMTPKRAMNTLAVLEFSRRKQMEAIKQRKTIIASSDLAEYLIAKIAHLQHEVFMVVFMNRANKIVHDEIISEGGITGTVADPRRILKLALDHRAVNIVLCHNHPSGSLKPSRPDEELTRKVKEAAKYFDIKVIDHVIVSETGYYSFADEGLL